MKLLVGAIEALGWPLRFILAASAKSACCVGAAYFLIDAMIGHGGPSSFVIAFVLSAIILGWSYWDGDKRLLQVKNSYNPKTSVKRLIFPALILGLAVAIVYENQQLLAVNNIESWSRALYLFWVLILIKGIILFIAMETICNAESFEFTINFPNLLCTGLFGVGLLAVMMNRNNDLGLFILLVTALFVIAAICLMTAESFRNIKDKSKA